MQQPQGHSPATTNGTLLLILVFDPTPLVVCFSVLQVKCHKDNKVASVLVARWNGSSAPNACAIIDVMQIPYHSLLEEGHRWWLYARYKALADTRSWQSTNFQCTIVDFPVYGGCWCCSDRPFNTFEICPSPCEWRECKQARLDVRNSGPERARNVEARTIPMTRATSTANRPISRASPYPSQVNRAARW